MFPNPAINPIVAVNPGHYLLKGDFNGIIPIQSITFVGNPIVVGQPATATITLTFFEPLPDDRFTLTLSDHLVDDVGNALDGESNASQPLENPSFPSGDGQPGGDFVARFTIDTRPELGAWNSGSEYVDTNGNFKFDPDNLDYTNRDITYTVHYTNDGRVTANPGAIGVVSDKFLLTDNVVAGNFFGAGADKILGTVDDRAGTAIVGNPDADRFDKFAAYGKDSASKFRWLIDTDNDGVADIKTIEPTSFNGLPFTGNFDGIASNGDEVGLFDGTSFRLDTDHNFVTNLVIATPLRGVPFAGDFDGDGKDDLGTYSDGKFYFDLASNGLGVVTGGAQGDASIYAGPGFGFIGVRSRPVAADMDQDGIDDVGLWVPDRTGQLNQAAEWYFLISNDPKGKDDLTGNADLVLGTRAAGTVKTLDHAFSPVPFGKDLYAIYGDQYSLPVIGNFDPPVAGSGEGPTPGPSNTNELNPRDVDADTFVTPTDVIILINEINANNSHALGTPTGAPPYFDVDRDGFIAPNDIINVINFLNGVSGGEGEGEGVGFVETSSSSSDAATNGSAAIAASPLSAASLSFQFDTLATSESKSVLAPAAVQTKPKDAAVVATNRDASHAAIDQLLDDSLLELLADDVTSQIGSAADNSLAARNWLFGRI